MQQDNATQQGAESLQPAYAGRTAALAQIAKQVDARYQEDLTSFNEETGQIDPKQATEPPAQAAEPEEADEQQETQETQAQTEDLETIVVDGQQVQVKRSQLFDAGKRTLQKEATADKRLQEATEMLNRARALEASLRQQYQPSNQDAGGNQSPSSDATNGNGEQQATQRQAIDPRALVRQELWLDRAETAVERFKTEFADIAADPMLMRLAAQLEDERLAKAAAEGTPLQGDPWEAYRKHGETIRERFGKPDAGKPVVSQDRIERKRSTTTVVGASARMQPSQPTKPPTRDEIIEQMRVNRSRGFRQLPTSR